MDGIYGGRICNNEKAERRAQKYLDPYAQKVRTGQKVTFTNISFKNS